MKMRKYHSTESGSSTHLQIFIDSENIHFHQVNWTVYRKAHIHTRIKPTSNQIQNLKCDLTLRAYVNICVCVFVYIC